MLRALVVAPGFVDSHALRGQADMGPVRDTLLLAWCENQVFGNGGVGFATVEDGRLGYLINMMDGVEDIPALGERRREVRRESSRNISMPSTRWPRREGRRKLPHGALRFMSLGERGARHDEVP